MNSIENELYTELRELMKISNPECHLTSETLVSTKKLPLIEFHEMDNYTAIHLLDTSNKEKFSEVLFEVNVYSNKLNGKKTECKNLLKIVDSFMIARNFIRTFKRELPTLDTNIYRITAHYRAIVDHNNKLYRRY